MLGEEGLDSAPCIRCRYRLWSGAHQFHDWAERQRPVRFVVQKGVTGLWIDLDIVRYAVSAQRLPKRRHAADHPVPAAVAGDDGTRALGELVDISRHRAVID